MQRYIIFNKKSKILIAKSSQVTETDDFQNIITCDNENFKQVDFSSLFNDENTKNTLFLCDKISEEEVFAFSTQSLYHVFAAGGIIENENKELLFMWRNNCWDLPKGHCEQGESFETAAKREVMEETGITRLFIENFFDITYHTYHMHNRQELKHTYWYKMNSSHLENLIPQTQEGISKVLWVKRDSLTSVLANTYPNIKLLLGKLSQKK